MAALLSSPTAAWGHDDKGEFTVEEAAPVEPMTIRFVVRLVFSQDREGAVGATVTATPITPQGEARTPVVLDAIDQEGRYGGLVTFDGPGAWTVRFSSVTPLATVEQPAVIAAPPTTSAPATTSTTGSVGSVTPTGSSATAKDSKNETARYLAIGAGILGTLALTVGVMAAARARRSSGTERAKAD